MTIAARVDGGGSVFRCARRGLGLLLAQPVPRQADSGADNRPDRPPWRRWS